MATIPASLKTRIDTDWTGAGGTAPTVTLSETYRVSPPLGKDAVWIITSSLDSDELPVNDTYVNEVHTIDLIVNTATDEDRLKELTDEVVRILGATAITGATYQRVKKRRNISDKKTFNFQELIKVDIREQMKASASAYGAGAGGDFTSIGDIIVGGDDIKDSSSTTVISFDGAGAIDLLELGVSVTECLDEDAMGSDSATKICTQQSIKAYVDAVVLSDLDTTLTGAYLEDLLMFGSANAAWVPMSFLNSETDGNVITTSTLVANAGANDDWWVFELPLPTVKSGLKLYITGLRVDIYDADAGDYISRAQIYGSDYNTLTSIMLDETDYNSQQRAEYALADTDCSGYSVIRVRFYCVNTNALDLKLSGVTMSCFYDT